MRGRPCRPGPPTRRSGGTRVSRVGFGVPPKPSPGLRSRLLHLRAPRSSEMDRLLRSAGCQPAVARRGTLRGVRFFLPARFHPEGHEEVVASSRAFPLYAAAAFARPSGRLEAGDTAGWKPALRRERTRLACAEGRPRPSVPRDRFPRPLRFPPLQGRSEISAVFRPATPSVAGHQNRTFGVIKDHEMVFRVAPRFLAF